MNKEIKPVCPKCGEKDNIGIGILQDDFFIYEKGTKFIFCFVCDQIASFNKELIEVCEIEFNRRKALRRQEKINEILED